MESFVANQITVPVRNKGQENEERRTFFYITTLDPDVTHIFFRQSQNVDAPSYEFVIPNVYLHRPSFTKAVKFHSSSYQTTYIYGVEQHTDYIHVPMFIGRFIVEELIPHLDSLNSTWYVKYD